MFASKKTHFQSASTSELCLARELRGRLKWYPNERQANMQQLLTANLNSKQRYLAPFHARLTLSWGLTPNKWVAVVCTEDATRAQVIRAQLSATTPPHHSTTTTFAYHQQFNFYFNIELSNRQSVNIWVLLALKLSIFNDNSQFSSACFPRKRKTIWGEKSFAFMRGKLFELVIWAIS